MVGCPRAARLRGRIGKRVRFPRGPAAVRAALPAQPLRTFRGKAPVFWAPGRSSAPQARRPAQPFGRPAEDGARAGQGERFSPSWCACTLRGCGRFFIWFRNRTHRHRTAELLRLPRLSCAFSGRSVISWKPLLLSPPAADCAAGSPPVPVPRSRRLPRLLCSQGTSPSVLRSARRAAKQYRRRSSIRTVEKRKPPVPYGRMPGTIPTSQTVSLSMPACASRTSRESASRAAKAWDASPFPASTSLWAPRRSTVCRAG